MIKVCHVITSLSMGGAEVMLYKLLTQTNYRRYDPTVISLTGNGPAGEMIKGLGISVITLGMLRGVPDLGCVYRLTKFLRSIRPNIVQTWMYHSDLIGGISAKLAGRLPVVWNVRHANLDKGVNKRSTIWAAQVCAILSNHVPERIVCNSQAAHKVHAVIGYSSNKLVVIPNGFDTDIFRPNLQAKLEIRRQLGITDGAILVGLVGRFDPQKDHLTFVRAAEMLIKGGLNVHFVLCGEGTTPHNQVLVKWIGDCGCSEFFHLLGQREDIAKLIASFDIAASSSLGESFSNVIGEAMACAVPCVVTDVGDSALVVGDTGAVVPPEDPEALAEALCKLISMQEEERLALGKQARERIIKYYSLATVVRQYETMYEEILGIGSAGEMKCVG